MLVFQTSTTHVTKCSHVSVCTKATRVNSAVLILLELSVWKHRRQETKTNIKKCDHYSACKSTLQSVQPQISMQSLLCFCPAVQQILNAGGCLKTSFDQSFSNRHKSGKKKKLNIRLEVVQMAETQVYNSKISLILPWWLKGDVPCIFPVLYLYFGALLKYLA